MAKTSGGQPGNQNAARGSAVKRALRRSLAQYAQKLADEGEFELPDGNEAATFEDGLRAIGDTVVEQAAEGNERAWTEILHRFDGKPTQMLGQDEENPLPTGIAIQFIDPEKHDDDSSDPESS